MAPPRSGSSNNFRAVEKVAAERSGEVLARPQWLGRGAEWRWLGPARQEQPRDKAEHRAGGMGPGGYKGQVLIGPAHLSAQPPCQPPAILGQSADGLTQFKFSGLPIALRRKKPLRLTAPHDLAWLDLSAHPLGCTPGSQQVLTKHQPLASGCCLQDAVTSCHRPHCSPCLPGACCTPTVPVSAALRERRPRPLHPEQPSLFIRQTGVLWGPARAGTSLSGRLAWCPHSDCHRLGLSCNWREMPCVPRGGPIHTSQSNRERHPPLPRDDQDRHTAPECSRL